jgi:integrase
MKTVERTRGLYKNGSRWWLRVQGTPRSTGTSDLVRANRIAAMVTELQDGNGLAQDWLARVASSDVSLSALYDARSSGTLHELKKTLAEKGASDADADLDPWVAKWAKEHLPALDISERQRDEYLRQVRVLIPEGARFPKSRFTEDTLKKTLHGLSEPRSGAPLSGSTKRRYAVAWKLFYRYARKRVPLVVNPFDEPDWIPANGSPRSTFWDHDTTLRVLAAMEGPARVAMTLVFGSGMELGALLAMEGRHFNRDRTVVAPGTKNEYREDRTIFVNEWAWETVKAHAQNIGSRSKLFTLGEKELREAFYCAQVKCGLIAAPAKSEATGKLLWGQVDPHTIHDARHTYCVVRLLGLDGEPRQSAKYCSMQLGHADEQMVMKIYSKANLDQRLRMIELAEARNTGRAA